MNYTLHQLKIFVAIVKHKSVTEASKELLLTQPAVSIQLKNFQNQFGIPLTEVIGRKIYITDFGERIAELAHKILQETEAMNYIKMRYNKMLAGKLVISVASTGKYVMPYFLAGFLKQHPGIDLNMDVTNKTLVTKSLENNEVDFSLVSVIPDTIKSYAETLLDNKLYMIGSAELLAENQDGFMELLARYPLLFREPGSATRQAMEAYIDQHQLPISKKIELTSNEALKQAVIAGLGFSIMPLIGIKNEINNGTIQIIPKKNLPIITSWNLIWLKGKMLSPVAEAFLQYVRENKTEIIKSHFDWCDLY
jgi:DNA-binding transcriptional LysR family regulator